MTKKLTLLLIALLCLTVAGCLGDMLNAQSAKDRDLGAVVEENMKTSDEFRDFIVSFTFDGVPGQYRAVTKDISDAQRAGRFGYNAMIVLDERNNTKVKSGRSEFKIIGEQGGVETFEVTMAAGQSPQVTLKGPYTGEVYTPGN
jgi:hypothetical protein